MDVKECIELLYNLKNLDKKLLDLFEKKIYNESFKVKNSSVKSCVNMADLYKYFLKIQLNSGIIQ